MPFTQHKRHYLMIFGDIYYIHDNVSHKHVQHDYNINMSNVMIICKKYAAKAAQNAYNNAKQGNKHSSFIIHKYF